MSEETIDEIKLSDPIDKVNRIFSFIAQYGWLTIILIYIIVSHWFCFVRSSGESMMPTIKNDQFFFCNRTISDYNYNDVVVIQTDEPYLLIFHKKLIKRVVGLPGDTLVIKDGYLYVNGKKIESAYPIMEDSGILSEEYTLGDDMYFVLGDNRNNSYDSRFAGAFNKSQIYGLLNVE